ncbi:MAG: GNAT family N-acetyltransferase [Hyphomicrobiales bacterium]|nr:GNAT family N-acetyltransferase [Hyphomicrobiales bacterium]MDE2115709.1 GNAT family N-acetyltransferase [Hyphomicrobiales bacterium]
MAKPPIAHPVLNTQRLRLRQFRLEDAEAMHRCFSSAEAMRFWNLPAHVRTIETERAVRSFIDCTPSYYRFWAVADAGTDLCLGLVNYHNGHIRSQRVDIGYIIDPAHQRKGIASEAVSALLGFCFGERALHRVQAFIDPANLASRRLVERLGFHEEGLLRDHLRVNDIWRDDLVYALLQPEFRAQRALNPTVSPEILDEFLPRICI